MSMLSGDQDSSPRDPELRQLDLYFYFIEVVERIVQH